MRLICLWILVCSQIQYSYTVTGFIHDITSVSSDKFSIRRVQFSNVNEPPKRQVLPSVSRGALSISAYRSQLLWALFTTKSPNQRPMPRRNLKKRPSRQNGRNRRANRRNIIHGIKEKDDFPWDTAEIRPLGYAKAKESGTDYWMDEEELAKSIEMEKAYKNRKAMETEISQDKLKSEVVAPYKQNWIGLVSVSFIVLAVIIQQFPDLLDYPLIPIPDL